MTENMQMGNATIAELNNKTLEKSGIEAFKSLAEPDEGFNSRICIDWDYLEKLANEILDDDPVCEITGYAAYDLDIRTKDILRAKGMIKARDNLAKVVGLICGAMEGPK